MPSAGEYARPVRLRVGTAPLTRVALTAAISIAVLTALGLSAMAIHLKLLTLLMLGVGTWLVMLSMQSALEGAVLLLRSDGSARLTLSTGKQLDGEWLTRSWVTPLLCVLSFRHGAGRYRLAVYRHRQSAGEFRRLVVLLRHAGLHGRDGSLI